MEAKLGLEKLEGPRLEPNQVVQPPQLKLFARFQTCLLTGAMKAGGLPWKTADDAANELEKSSSG